MGELLTAAGGNPLAFHVRIELANPNVAPAVLDEVNQALQEISQELCFKP